MKGDQDFKEVVAGGLRWWIRKGSRGVGLDRILEDPDGFLESRSAILKRDGATTVGAAAGLVVKRVRVVRMASRFKDLFRPSRAQRASRKARELELAGIETARVLAVTSLRRRGEPAVSYLVMEEVRGAKNLRAWRGNRRQAVQDLASVIGRLHRAGFSHRDLKATNILFDAEGKPHVLDLDGMRRVRWLTPMRATADLARFIRSAAESYRLSRAERARFLIGYCQARGGQDWREWWRRLQRNKQVAGMLSGVDPGAGPRVGVESKEGPSAK